MLYEILLNIGFAGALLAALAGWAGAFLRRGAVAIISAWLLGVVLTTLALAIGLRWHEAQHPPFTNLYEGLVFLSWACALLAILFFAARGRLSLPPMVSSLTLASGGTLATCILAFSSLLDPRIKPLIPALRSNWLVFHVSTCFLAYAAFALAFMLAVILLGTRRKESVEALDRLGFQLMKLGFLLLMLGIASGAVWAREAWGAYWSWDPKETWALVTAGIYGLCIHIRVLAERMEISREKLVKLHAVCAVVGFAAVLFTLLGVSFLLPGLHSYA